MGPSMYVLTFNSVQHSVFVGRFPLETVVLTFLVTRTAEDVVYQWRQSDRDDRVVFLAMRRQTTGALQVVV